MTASHEERIPTLTLGWRLKMSLGEMSRDKIAELMDVTPSTISRWMADKGAPPKRPYLVQWALATGVPLSWLEAGRHDEDNPTPPRPGKRDNSALAALIAEKSGRAATDRYSTFQPGFGTAA